jgi:hypothetical protein
MPDGRDVESAVPVLAISTLIASRCCSILIGHDIMNNEKFVRSNQR